MPRTECCVPLCKNRGGHRFPSVKGRENVRKQWILAIRRADSVSKFRLWEPSPHSVVCSSHFLSSDFFTETTFGYDPQVKRLKPSAVPSVFSWTKSSKLTDERTERLRKREESSTITNDSSENNEDSRDFEDYIAAELEVQTSSDTYPVETCDTGTDPFPPLPLMHDAATGPAFNINSQILSSEKFRHDPQGMHNYTGLQDFVKFMFVFTTLGPAVDCLTYIYGPVSNVLSVVDRFFLVLVKLRKNYTNFDLSRLFCVSEADVYNIFCTWIRFISLQWREVDIWPSRDLVRFYSPSGFKEDFPNTRIIIDGTEIPINKPKLPTAQQATYSTYKNRNTVKVLAGISPGGMCTFMSPAYGGSASDRQVVERSTLMQDCDPGDSVMSDKGFDVQDLFAPYQVAINIPTFFKKKNRMDQKTVQSDRKISSKRIHVERFIGIAKSYKILKSPLNSSETALSSDITFICFMLCNFRSCIVSGNA